MPQPMQVRPSHLHQSPRSSRDARDRSSARRQVHEDEDADGSHAGDPHNDGPDYSDFHALARLMERIHRRFLDVVRGALLKSGVEDIGPVQAMMVMLIGDDMPSVRDLMERGYYLGTNASYSLKILVAAGYIERGASQRDRRTARLRLTDKGRKLRDNLLELERVQAEMLIRSDEEAADLKGTYRTMRKLDRIWSDMIRYSGQDLD